MVSSGYCGSEDGWLWANWGSFDGDVRNYARGSLELWVGFHMDCSLGCGRLMGGECYVVVLLVLNVRCVSLVYFLSGSSWHVVAGDGDWFKDLAGYGKGSVVSGCYW